MPEKTEPKAVVVGELNLAEADTVLVKFSFTNLAHIPTGVSSIKRPSDADMDEKHRKAAEAFKAELGQIGRVREGRVDTGEPVIRDLQGVQAMLLRGGLVGAGFGLKNLHWFKQERTGKTTKYVVVCEFARGADTLPEDKLVLENLATDAKWACHVWLNPSRLATINFVGRQPDAMTKHFLIIVAGKLMAVEAD